LVIDLISNTDSLTTGLRLTQGPPQATSPNLRSPPPIGQFHDTTQDTRYPIRPASALLRCETTASDDLNTLSEKWAPNLDGCRSDAARSMKPVTLRPILADRLPFLRKTERGNPVRLRIGGHGTRNPWPQHMFGRRDGLLTRLPLYHAGPSTRIAIGYLVSSPQARRTYIAALAGTGTDATPSTTFLFTSTTNRTCAAPPGRTAQPWSSISLTESLL